MGYEVAVGYTGFFQSHPDRVIPDDLDARDLLLVDLEPGWQPRPREEIMPTKSVPPGSYTPTADHARDPIDRNPPLHDFRPALERGGLAVVLLEEHPTGFIGTHRNDFDWLPTKERVATTGVRIAPSLVARNDYPTGIQKLLADHGGDVVAARQLTGIRPILADEAGHFRAGFQLVGPSPPAGGVLFLPFFRRKVPALRRLLAEVLPQHNADLFPAPEQDWTGDDRYQMPGVQALRAARKAEQDRHADELERLEQEELRARSAQEQFTALLTKTGTALAPHVAAALDRLGFEVTDVDKEREKAGKPLEEDLRIGDGAYFAVVSVKSSKGNAKEDDFMDVAKFQRFRERTPSDDQNGREVRGMLVMNQLYTTAPASRAVLFEHNTNRDWDQEAREWGYALVSTWVLFRLLQEVAAGRMSAEAAREHLKQPGIVPMP